MTKEMYRDCGYRFKGKSCKECPLGCIGKRGRKTGECTIIKWILFMPFIWLMDYLYGIINQNFREAYLAVQEKLAEYMKESENE